MDLASTVAMLKHENPGRWEVYHVVGLGLAIGASLLIRLHSNPDLFWLKWGVWLYASVAAVALILEVVWKAASQRAYQGFTEQFIKLVR
jgi:hypothetical protein